jgi:rhodanese-related sulfurtransferase
MTTAEFAARVANIDPATVRDWLSRGEAVLVDVREPFEHAAERIEGAALCPLSAFDEEQVARQANGKRVVFQCRSGKRSLDAATRFGRASTAQAYNLVGGIEGWKAAGLPVHKPAGAPKIDVMRQVQMTAGSLVLVGVLLGAFVSPWFLILSGLVGGGLVFAGASGWCGMAKMLALMPWNRRRAC